MSYYNVDLKFKGSRLLYDTDDELDFIDFINVRLPELLKPYFNE